MYQASKFLNQLVRFSTSSLNQTLKCGLKLLQWIIKLLEQSYRKMLKVDTKLSGKL